MSPEDFATAKEKHERRLRQLYPDLKEPERGSRRTAKAALMPLTWKSDHVRTERAAVTAPAVQARDEARRAGIMGRVHAAAAELIRQRVADGGDAIADGERWLIDYLHSHPELQAELHADLERKAVRAIVMRQLDKPWTQDRTGE